MDNKKFKIGDRVIVIGDVYGRFRTTESTAPVQPGDTGTICDYLDSTPNGTVVFGIDFDRIIRAGHDCNGSAKMHHGLWVMSKHLKHLDRILSIKDWIAQKRKFKS